MKKLEMSRGGLLGLLICLIETKKCEKIVILNLSSDKFKFISTRISRISFPTFISVTQGTPSVISVDGFETFSRNIRTNYLTLFYPGSEKTLLPGRGHYGPPVFFRLGATKSPKLNLGTFLALKTT